CALETRSGLADSLVAHARCRLAARFAERAPAPRAPAPELLLAQPRSLEPVCLRELRERDEAQRAGVPVVAERRERSEKRLDRGALARVDRPRVGDDRDRAPLLRGLARGGEIRQVGARDRLDRARVVAVRVAADRRRLEEREVAG